LKEESYLLFRQAHDAWQASPLYQIYLKVLELALARNLTIADAVKEGEMSEEEFKVMVEVGKMVG
jgi:hypothetical protein